jgi:hypothetical protein
MATLIWHQICEQTSTAKLPTNITLFRKNHPTIFSLPRSHLSVVFVFYTRNENETNYLTNEVSNATACKLHKQIIRIFDKGIERQIRQQIRIRIVIWTCGSATKE